MLASVAPTHGHHSLILMSPSSNKKSLSEKLGDVWQKKKKRQTDSVTDMSHMFSGRDKYPFKLKTGFNQNIDSWQTGKVTDMASLFRCASKFNQPVNSYVYRPVYSIDSSSLLLDAKGRALNACQRGCKNQVQKKNLLNGNRVWAVIMNSTQARPSPGSTSGEVPFVASLGRSALSTIGTTVIVPANDAVRAPSPTTHHKPQTMKQRVCVSACVRACVRAAHQ